MYTSYYKLGNFCVCVCLSVCLSVCPAIRFHSSQRIFSKFGGNLLRVMTCSAGYICAVCTQCARMRVRAKRAHMCAFAYFWTDSVHICWEHTTTHHKWQGLHTFHVHTPRASARARVIKCLLIYGRILFKFAKNILQVTSSSMGYVLLTHTHAPRASERTRARVCKRARD
jgi:hypothetical protein